MQPVLSSFLKDEYLLQLHRDQVIPPIVPSGNPLVVHNLQCEQVCLILLLLLQWMQSDRDNVPGNPLVEEKYR